MAGYDGEQGARVYEHLAGLAPDEGVTMGELMAIADTTEGRVTQLLVKIRNGRLPEPHQKAGRRYPPLNVNFDRVTNRYYNLGAGSGSTATTADVLSTWLEDSITRTTSLGAALKAQLDAASAAEPEHAAAILAAIPDERMQDFVNVALSIADTREAAIRLRRKVQRHR